MKRIKIPQDIGDFVAYDPEQGTLTWKVDRGYNKLQGKEIKNIDAFGYNVVAFNKRFYKAHRVIFHLMGEEVPEYVDHKNGDRLDNRWCNLRAATATQNTTNSKPRSNAQHPFKGVDFSKEWGKFRARITEGKKTRLIGYYQTAEEAAEAYNQESLKVFGEFAKVIDLEVAV